MLQLQNYLMQQQARTFQGGMIFVKREITGLLLSVDVPVANVASPNPLMQQLLQQQQMINGAYLGMVREVCARTKVGGVNSKHCSSRTCSSRSLPRSRTSSSNRYTVAVNVSPTDSFSLQQMRALLLQQQMAAALLDAPTTSSLSLPDAMQHATHHAPPVSAADYSTALALAQQQQAALTDPMVFAQMLGNASQAGGESAWWLW